MLNINTPNPSNNLACLFFDGGSRGNPGKAAGGAVIIMPDGKKHRVGKFLPFATNNEAEYTGLIIGLTKAKLLGITALEVKGDSNLVINQVKGVWRVKNDNLHKLYHKVHSLIKEFSQITINWIPREENKQVDTAVNQCLDKY